MRDAPSYLEQKIRILFYFINFVRIIFYKLEREEYFEEDNLNRTRWNIMW